MKKTLPLIFKIFRCRAASLRAALLAVALLLLFPTGAHPRQAAPAQNLERAVASLRNIDASKLTEAQADAKSQELDAAWDTITKAGPAGVARLKTELRRLDETKVRDDRFRLAAAALLWDIAKFDEAEAIASIWSTTPLKAQYYYVFYTAFEAAETHDERALPMLRAILRDKEGEVFFTRHAMKVAWPLTHEFIWGAFGAKGAASLSGILETSSDPIEQASATLGLAAAQQLTSLARIRQLAATGKGDARHAAVRALGIFGHPQDYDFLVAGLRSPDAAIAFSHAFALYEYEDLRAVPLLVPLLEAPDEQLQAEAVAALTHLLTPAALEALQRHSQTSKKPSVRAGSDDFVKSFLEETQLTWRAYMKLSPPEKLDTVKRWRDNREGMRLVAGGQGQPLTHVALVRLAESWKSSHRLERPGGARVEVGEILSAATPADIDLLLDVKAALYHRLSDECLYEVRRIDAAVRHLGRSRYRKTTRITERAEAK
jgi:hypothetical protein